MLGFASDLKVAIIGLGYVGLPLAIEFAKVRSVVGFDINKTRVSELRNLYDSTSEVSASEISAASELLVTNDLKFLKECNCFVICVPTPIDENKQPDLSNLYKASELVGSIIKNGDLIIYESTVFPGATEEVCVPILEKMSDLIFNEDFYVGYSPERVNPGDKLHKIPNIVKITSGSNVYVADVVDKLYNEIVEVGTHKAKSIKIAESAKCIENIQRDLNIALMNELSMLFNKLDIDFKEVLEAASTKWNFLPFKPGLVGGHCIGVDPYYLTYKASHVGLHPKMILAGRGINDGMAVYAFESIVEKMRLGKINLPSSKVGILGVTFKENCPDIRNSKVVDLIRCFQAHNIEVVVHDNQADYRALKKEFDIDLIQFGDLCDLDALIVAVSHKEFLKINIDVLKNMYRSDKNYILGDLKGLFDKEILQKSGFDVFTF